MSRWIPLTLDVRPVQLREHHDARAIATANGRNLGHERATSIALLVGTLVLGAIFFATLLRPLFTSSASP